MFNDINWLIFISHHDRVIEIEFIIEELDDQDQELIKQLAQEHRQSMELLDQLPLRIPIVPQELRN
jgi:uncharacterized membrane protein